MKIFTKILITGALIFGLFGILTPPVFATNGIDICSGDGKGSIYCDNKAGSETKVNSIIGNIIQVLLTAVGVISVIMIVIGGIMFTLSSGDAQKAAKARNTILYAVVGLVVAVFASAIVNFVFDGFK